MYGGGAARKAGDSAFGNALYELKEEFRKGTTYMKEAATFYEDFVVLNKAEQLVRDPSQ